jgi:hypothetical protein
LTTVGLEIENAVTNDSNQILSDQIIRTRIIAQNKLARYAKLPPENCKDIYLFAKEQFCGVRFTLGAFFADWRIGGSSLTVIRNGHALETVDISETPERRAA